MCELKHIAFRIGPVAERSSEARVGLDATHGYASAYQLVTQVLQLSGDREDDFDIRLHFPRGRVGDAIGLTNPVQGEVTRPGSTAHSPSIVSTGGS